MSWAVVPCGRRGCWASDFALLGRGGDAGRIAVHSAARSRWVVPKDASQVWGPGIKADVVALPMDPDGAYGAGATYGDGAAWYSPDGREWVYAPGLAPGAPPREILVPATYNHDGTVDDPEHYEGDEFYTFDHIPGPGETVALRARGSLRRIPEEATGKSVAWHWPRHERAEAGDPWGGYVDCPDDGAPSGSGSAAFSIGCLRFTAGPFAWIRSAVRGAGGLWEYVPDPGAPGTPPLGYSAEAGKWVVGVYGAEEGWRESASEPSESAAATFAGAVPEGSEEPTPASLAVSFDRRVGGRCLVADAYLAEVPRWL